MADTTIKPVGGVPARTDAQAPAKKAEPESYEELHRRKLQVVTPSDFYKVGREQGPDGRWQDRREPSARVWEKWANEGQPISTKIVSWTCDDKGCSVTVRGWIGPEDRPKAVKEEVVSIVWVHALESLMLDAVRNGITIEKKADGAFKKELVMPPFDVTTPGADGASRIVLRDPAHQVHVLAQMNRIKNFGVRVCTTKASSRVYKRLLSHEWRDQDEIDYEATEAKLAGDDLGEDTPPPPPSNPDTSRLIPPPSVGTPPASGDLATAMALTSLVTRFTDLGEGFPLPTNVGHKEYITCAGMGLMLNRGAELKAVALDGLTKEECGKLWQMVGAVSHQDEQALASLDALYKTGRKAVDAIRRREVK